MLSVTIIRVIQSLRVSSTRLSEVLGGYKLCVVVLRACHSHQIIRATTADLYIVATSSVYLCGFTLLSYINVLFHSLLRNNYYVAI